MGIVEAILFGFLFGVLIWGVVTFVGAAYGPPLVDSFRFDDEVYCERCGRHHGRPLCLSGDRSGV